MMTEPGLCRMDDAARRFRGLCACEQANNPFLIIGVADWDPCSGRFLREVKKRRKGCGFGYCGQRRPLRDAKNLGSRFAMQRHERQSAVGRPEIDTDAETGSCHRWGLSLATPS